MQYKMAGDQQLYIFYLLQWKETLLADVLTLSLSFRAGDCSSVGLEAGYINLCFLENIQLLALVQPY